MEKARQSVIGIEPRLPPFDLQALPKLPFDIEVVFAEDMNEVDFGEICR